MRTLYSISVLWWGACLVLCSWTSEHYATAKKIFLLFVYGSIQKIPSNSYIWKLIISRWFYLKSVQNSVNTWNYDKNDINLLFSAIIFFASSAGFYLFIEKFSGEFETKQFRLVFNEFLDLFYNFSVFC